MTDVTGFAPGRTRAGDGARGRVHGATGLDKVPFLRGVRQLAQQGCITGASARNWAAYGHEVSLPFGFSAVEQALLTDPQTSGGLLVSCAPQAVEAVMAIFQRMGFADAADIGEVSAFNGAAHLALR